MYPRRSEVKDCQIQLLSKAYSLLNNPNFDYKEDNTLKCVRKTNDDITMTSGGRQDRRVQQQKERNLQRS